MGYLRYGLLLFSVVSAVFSSGYAGKPGEPIWERHETKSYGMVIIGSRQSFLFPITERSMDSVDVTWDEGSIARRLRHPHSPVTPAIADHHKWHLHTSLVLLFELYRPFLGTKAERRWSVNVTPYCSGLENAHFSPDENRLTFGLFKNKGHWVGVCESLDVVLHEGGHGILHHASPAFSEELDIHMGALHETFGDLTTYFVREKTELNPIANKRIRV